MTEFEWDAQKEISNIQKRGIDFTTASRIWDGRVFERIDARHHYGEVRYQAFDIAANRILTVVFTWRAETRRLISARRASAYEKKLFETEIAKPDSSPSN